MEERKTVDEMLEWLGLCTDIDAIEDKTALNWDEDYCALYDKAYETADEFYTHRYNWRNAWHWVLYNWKRSRLTDRRHFDGLLAWAKEDHDSANKAKPAYLKARQAFAEYLEQQNKEWLEAV